MTAKPKRNTPIASPNPPTLPPTAEQVATCSSQPSQSTSSRQPRCNIARKLKLLTDGLAEAVPEAQADDKFAGLEEYIKNIEDGEGEELWQSHVNPLLKGLLGWSTDLDAGAVIRRGVHGVGGLVGVVDFFIVERGVPESLFEGKLSVLMEELKKQ